MFSSLFRLLKDVRHHHLIDYLADANSVISAIALYPQLFDLLRSHEREGISTLSFFLIAVNSCIWFLYGIHRKTPPLIISSAANALAAFVILILLIT